MALPKLLVTRSDEVMSGAVVFTGTRVPVPKRRYHSRLDYILDAPSVAFCPIGLSSFVLRLNSLTS